MWVASICDGCGKKIEAQTLEDLETLRNADGNWFVANDETAYSLASIIFSCSADCITAAREATKKYWRDWAERQAAVIDAAKFERIK